MTFNSGAQNADGPADATHEPDFAGEVSQMDRAIVAYVKKYERVTYVQLIRELGVAAEGDYVLTWPDDRNVILWEGVSSEFREAMDRLLKEERIYYWPDSRWTYFDDGCVLVLPVVEELPKGGHERPHWLPVTFYTRPHPLYGKTA